MKLDRRAFVKLALGSVVGITASPLALKLMDDTAIWTQNWSWVPVPEGGELAFAATTNPATGTACQVRIIKARMDGERLIRVEGNPSHPLCGGGALASDSSALQMAYDKSCRVSAPLVRDPKTGLRTEVTAEEAVSYVAKRLKAMQDAGKAQELGIMTGDPDGLTGELLMRFAAAFGTPNLSGPARAQDTLALAGLLMLGQSELGFDLKNAECVVSFGTPLLENFGAPVQTRKAFAAWQSNKKAKYIQVEARSSVSSGKADLWLACKPGSSGAVALGMCQLLAASGRLSGAAASAQGFGEFKAMLKDQYSPAQVEKLTGVPAAKLQAAAKDFAASDKAVAVCGPGNAGDPGRLFDFMSVLALNVIKGNLGKPGGLVLRQPLPLKPLGEPLEAPQGDNLAAGGGVGPANFQAMADASLAGDPYQIGALIIDGCNPGFAWPQNGGMDKFLDQVPFVVAISAFMDETAEMADVVLPAGTFLEGWGDSGTPYGSPQASYGLHQPLVQINPAVKSSADWVLMLSQQMGGPVAQALPFDTAEAALSQRVVEMGELEELAQKGFWVQEEPAYGDMPFRTPSGKVEFFATVLHQAVAAGATDADGLAKAAKAAGITALGAAAFMPHYEPAPATSKEYPLLMAGIPSLRTGNGKYPISPYMVKVLTDDTLAHKTALVVEMNPATAKKLGLAEGKAAEITSAAGSIRALVHVFHGAPPGVVMVPMGLGHTALDPMFIRGKGANFFNAAQVSTDPGSGQPLWEYTPVAVKGVYHV